MQPASRLGGYQVDYQIPQIQHHQEAQQANLSQEQELFRNQSNELLVLGIPNIADVIRPNLVI